MSAGLLFTSVRDPELLACVNGALRSTRGSIRSREFSRSRDASLKSTSPLCLWRSDCGPARCDAHRGCRRSRRDFIANVSHELRTPLTSIQGYVETLVEDPHPNPATTYEFLQVILKNATRMNRSDRRSAGACHVESPDYKLATQPMRASALVHDASIPLVEWLLIRESNWSWRVRQTLL